MYNVVVHKKFRFSFFPLLSFRALTNKNSNKKMHSSLSSVMYTYKHTSGLKAVHNVPNTSTIDWLLQLMYKFWGFLMFSRELGIADALPDQISSEQPSHIVIIACGHPLRGFSIITVLHSPRHGRL